MNLYRLYDRPNELERRSGDMNRLTLHHRPSEKCENCPGWHEDQFLGLGCPNDPETRTTEDSDKEGTLACRREFWN